MLTEGYLGIVTIWLVGGDAAAKSERVKKSGVVCFIPPPPSISEWVDLTLVSRWLDEIFIPKHHLSTQCTKKRGYK